MLAPGMILGERYEIIEKIGAGGMSVVYKARCNRLQRYVAIKVLREEFAKDEAFVMKFKKEAFSAASLSHPNIVGIYDVGNDQEVNYIVMEYVEGHTLKQVIEQGAPFDSRRVLEFGVQIVSALKHAHSKKIIHRDIKPQNILVTNDGILKVTDFGIAKAVDSSTVVATGNAIGSVHYFSPEQAKGRYVNETSDLYSCGIVLFELATKRLPFEADTHISIALKHINEELPQPSAYNKNILPALEEVIIKATHKSQIIRYQSADEMLKDMTGILANPSYKVQPATMSTDQTILLSEEDINFLRQNDNQSRNKSGIEPMEKINEQRPYPNPAAKPSTLDSVKKAAPVEEEDTISTFHRVLVSIGGVLAALVLVGIITTAFFIIPGLGGNNYAMPSLIGKTPDEAKDLVKEGKLEIVVIGEEENNEVPEGTICKQDPEPNSIVKVKSKVKVTLAKSDESTNSEMVEVPSVVGMDIAQAQQTLEDNDLTVRVKRQYDDTIEIGQVISQDPESPARIEQGGVVTLVVSKGPEVVTVNMPNLLSMTVAEAKLSLNNNQLKLGNVKEENSDTVQAGLIMDQSVPANREVEVDTVIDIVVSKGKAEETTAPPAQTTPNIPPQSTVNFTVQAPFNNDKESYHVLVTVIDQSGMERTVYDATVRRENFPFQIQISGTGAATADTYFDGKLAYEDPIDFNGAQ